MIALSDRDVTNDLDQPVCDRCWKGATFAVVVDNNGPDRPLVCDLHLADALRDALLVKSFVPASVHAIDLDAYRPAAFELIGAVA